MTLDRQMITDVTNHIIYMINEYGLLSPEVKSYLKTRLFDLSHDEPENIAAVKEAKNLVHAFLHAHHPELEAEVMRIFDINQIENKSKLNPFWHHLIRGHLRTLHYLLQDEFLKLANSENSHKPLLAFLIEEDPRNRLFSRYSKEEYLELLDQMIEKGFHLITDKEGRNALMYLVSNPRGFNLNHEPNVEATKKLLAKMTAEEVLREDHFGRSAAYFAQQYSMRSEQGQEFLSLIRQKIGTIPARPHENLLQITASGNLAEVDIALKDGANINYPDPTSMNAVEMAVRDQHYDILQRLLFSSQQSKAIDAFLYAITHGDQKAIRLFLDSPFFDPNQGLKKGISPLIIAIESNQLAALELIAQHPRVNVAQPIRISEWQSRSLFDVAAHYGNTKAIEILLASGRFKVIMHDLDMARKLKNPAVTKLLQDSFVKAMNANEQLLLAATTGNMRLAKEALRNGADVNHSSGPEEFYSALERAIEGRHYDVMEALLQLPHKSTFYAFVRALVNKDKRAVVMLLASPHVDPNEQHAPQENYSFHSTFKTMPRDMPCCGYEINTSPIRAAIASKTSLEIFELMVANPRVDVNDEINSKTPLAFAVEFNRIGHIRILLNSGRIAMTEAKLPPEIRFQLESKPHLLALPSGSEIIAPAQEHSVALLSSISNSNEGAWRDCISVNSDDLICPGSTPGSERLVSKHRDFRGTDWQAIPDANYDCKPLSDGILGQHCDNGQVEYIERAYAAMTENPSTLGSIGSSATAGVIQAIVPDLFDKAVGLFGYHAPGIQQAANFALAFYNGSWISAGVTTASNVLLKNIFSDNTVSHNTVTALSNTLGHVAQMGTQVASPIGVASAAAHFFGGRIGLWAKSQAYQVTAQLYTAYKESRNDNPGNTYVP